MLFGLIDRSSSSSPLKAALDRSAERTRGIAHRIANGTVKNGDGFALEARPGAESSTTNPVNVEEDLAALGDEQLRFLATSRLLEKTYQSLRTAIKGNA